jgi:hypothetical protein
MKCEWSRGKAHLPHHWPIGILLLILVLAGTLRFVKLDEIPPGLHVDEAANAWNAYTLLKTGKPRTTGLRPWLWGTALRGVQNIHPVPTVMDREAPFSHDGVGTGFIPALTYGAFCGTG